ncbi:hypothetical protein E3226_008465 [Legionella geestiana]|uniref:hypothetical protein n=1 Tax=Legionella geestiana TaxID=45065 RepID=UPI00109295D9|nr:hypothetical protein [Legionella geestiana]QDQ40416.1 hypothetical protein E3226_008465 [Legionella geestiana]
MPKLHTQVEHLSHPLARHIPETVWYSRYFKRKALDAELQRIDGTLETASLPLHPGESPLKSLLCMMYGHIEHEVEAVLAASRAMGCDDLSIFIAGACVGHIDLLHALGQAMALEPKIQAIQAEDYHLYWIVALMGHLEILKHFESLMSAEQQLEAIKTLDYEGYAATASRGQLNILKHLESRMSKEQQLEAIKALDYTAYTAAAACGHLNILQHFESQISKEQQLEALQAGNYFSYREAAANGQRNILVHLESLMTPEQQLEALQANNYVSYREAAEYGHLHILEYLESRMNEAQIEEALRANSHAAYFLAAACSRQLVLEHLHRKPLVFAWAEMHMREYGHHVRPYAEARLQEWQEASEAFAASNPNGVFTLNATDARLAFYVARHLIRENTEEALEHLRFLMRIPGVAVLAHRAVTPNETNELLRLALATENEAAAAILLTLAPVRILAEENQFYVHEMQGGLDLRALAEDRESSMRVLTKTEQKRIRRIHAHYGEVLQFTGAENLLEILRERLRERCLDHPACITVNDTTIHLPLTWNEFLEMPLEQDAREAALKAYHAHPAHTALRWLLRPNPWMAENAAYVEGNPALHTGYSTFENYHTLIGLLWLAASDENTPATDGHTLEGRIEHFIRELALIGRAHNWDRTRPVQRADGTEAREEYDNVKEGDMPSCYSGVNRRLFQSVIGHPFMHPFGNDILEAELRDFARSHFLQQLTADKRAHLLDAEEAIANLEPLTGDQLEAMESLNISEEKGRAFIDSLQKKYAEEWTPACSAFLQDWLVLPRAGITTHVSSLWMLTDFSNLLRSPAPVASPSAAREGFFATTNSAASSGRQASSDNGDGYTDISCQSPGSSSQSRG